LRVRNANAAANEQIPWPAAPDLSTRYAIQSSDRWRQGLCRGCRL